MDERIAAASMLAVLVMSLVVAASSAAVAPEVLSPAGEAEALVAIKAALHDTANILGDWKFGSGGGDGPCHWSLVYCSDEGHVSGLELVHKNLSGTLSPAIGKLRRLRFLFLQHNAISGHIPDTIGRLKLLQRLDLAYNHFTGTIPATLGHPRGIFFVRLSHNNLSGSIPDSLATAHSIVLLDLSYNNLSGRVPVFNGNNVFLDGNPLLHNFSCEGSCSPVIEEPVDIPSAIEVPVAITIEDPSTHKRGLAGTTRCVAFYIAAALLIAFFIAGIVAIVWQWRMRHQIFADLEGPEVCLGHLKQFMIKEIQEATNNFDRKNILGQGGFGIVYKGRLRDGTIVAVKRMKDCASVCGDDQFHTEVEAKELLEENRLNSLVDGRLRNNYVTAELEEMVHIALLCTMYSPDHRPSMAEIVRMLEESDGSIAEKWEALKNVDRLKPSTPEFMLSPPVDFDTDEYNSIQLEAVELSGPRFINVSKKDANAAA
ncbi:hypothetical protein E2562_018708 [Oryza meyeriana var. granulata]|uniref:Leucine-rich repeat-containing N-terminal plant-type domain-containing protein n=1 Tax=Oryza meyeriana var. granulata TaxID=110450 RepID=A0A6G1EMQ6_9ORYZ|nr:hypothetical protein E2562_018708 [Oryza meyeriana var. granulata]